MIKKAALPVFFAFVLIFSWFPWYLGGSGFFPLGVSVAGLIVIGPTEGKQGYLNAIRRLAPWKVNYRWYAVALLWMGGIGIVTLIIHMMLGGKLPNFVFLNKDWTFLPLLLLGLFFPLSGPVGEETFGWRGYALPRLQKHIGPLFASLLVGAFYGAWHLPEFFRPGSSQYALGLDFYFPFIFLLVCASIYMTWLFNKSGGSTLVGGILFHAANNFWMANVLTSYQGETIEFPMVDRQLLWVLLGVSLAWAAGLVILTHGRLGLESNTGWSDHDFHKRLTIEMVGSHYQE